MPPSAPAAPPHLPVPLAVIVMGVSGSGKSTAGARIADALGCAFVKATTSTTPPRSNGCGPATR